MDSVDGFSLTVDDLLLQRSMDLRYVGQTFTLNIPTSTVGEAIDQFHETHQSRYGHKLNEQVELVNLRLSIKSQNRSLFWQKIPEKLSAVPINSVEMYTYDQPVPVYRRKDLGLKAELSGPAIIVEEVATTFLKYNWRCKVHETGHLQLEYDENN